MLAASGLHCYMTQTLDSHVCNAQFACAHLSCSAALAVDRKAAPSAATRQAMLTALGAVAQQFGSQHPQPLLAVLPVLVAAAKDPNSAVRGSALAATAATLAALGIKAVPVLPHAVPAVLAVAAQSISKLPVAATTQAPHTVSAEDTDNEDSMADAALEDEVQGAQAGSEGAEAAVVEAQAALAALAAMLEGLGAFLSPYLPELLRLLLSRHLLMCTAESCASAAASLRQKLTTVVPARLLLGPLFAQLQPMVQVGPVLGTTPSCSASLLLRPYKQLHMPGYVVSIVRRYLCHADLYLSV